MQSLREDDYCLLQTRTRMTKCARSNESCKYCGWQIVFPRRD